MKAIPYNRHPPPLPDMVQQHIKTVPISRNRELRVGIAITGVAASATIQKWVRESGSDVWEPAGRTFYVFRPEIIGLSKALMLAAQAIEEAA